MTIILFLKEKCGKKEVKTIRNTKYHKMNNEITLTENVNVNVNSIQVLLVLLSPKEPCLKKAYN